MPTSPPNSSPKILGLDPAANCGFAHSDGMLGVWLLAESTDKHPGRMLERLRRKLFTMKRESGIDILAAEDAGYGAANKKINWHAQAMHNEKRGVIKLCAAEWDIPLLMVNPTTLKHWLTGDGKAKKAKMIHWVNERFKIETNDDNIADAVAVMEFAKHMTAKKET